MQLTVVQQVVRQAEVAQGHEGKEAQPPSRKEDRVASQQGKAKKQRKRDQETQAGGGERRHAFHGDLDAQPGGAPADANNEKQKRADQSG
ncbi:hypothetical protein D9M68_480100 [compost metagenome]